MADQIKQQFENVRNKMDESLKGVGARRAAARARATNLAARPLSSLTLVCVRLRAAFLEDLAKKAGVRKAYVLARARVALSFVGAFAQMRSRCRVV